VALRLENKKPEDLFLAQAWWSFGLLFRVLVDIFFCLAEARSGNFWVVRFWKQMNREAKTELVIMP
jgi:hypothetical protein